MTGLRKSELASITLAQTELDGPSACLRLSAPDAKNRQSAQIPLRGDLAKEVGEWLADRLDVLRGEGEGLGQPTPARLPADTPLFNVPKGLVKIFDRDLKLAGIPKRDARGRTVDVHALRTTFATHLSMGGVPLRTAQAALRHSDPKLTANVYTDPQLLDVKGALDSLPELPLTGPRAQRDAKAANQESYSPLAPTLAPTPVESCISGSLPDNSLASGGRGIRRSSYGLTRTPVKTCQRESARGAESKMAGTTGLEPATSCVTGVSTDLTLKATNRHLSPSQQLSINQECRKLPSIVKN